MDEKTLTDLASIWLRLDVSEKIRTKSEEPENYQMKMEFLKIYDELKEQNKHWFKVKSTATYFTTKKELHFRVRNVGEWRDDSEWRVTDVIVLEDDRESYLSWYGRLPTEDELLSRGYGKIDYKSLTGKPFTKSESSYLGYGRTVYQLLNDESFTEGELSYLEWRIDNILLGKIANTDSIYTDEPIYRIFVGVDKYNKPFLTMKMDCTSIKLNASNMLKLTWYLKLKKGIVSLDDEVIRSMFREGFLYRSENRKEGSINE